MKNYNKTMDTSTENRKRKSTSAHDKNEELAKKQKPNPQSELMRLLTEIFQEKKKSDLELAKKTTELEKIRSQYAALTQNLSSYKLRLSKLTSLDEEGKEKTNVTNSQLKEITAQFENKKQQLSHVTKEKEALQKQVLYLNDDKHRLRESLNKQEILLRNEITAGKEQQYLLQTNLDNLKTFHNETLIKLVVDHQQQLEALNSLTKREIDTLTKERNHAETQYNEAIEFLRSQSENQMIIYKIMRFSENKLNTEFDEYKQASQQSIRQLQDEIVRLRREIVSQAEKCRIQNQRQTPYSSTNSSSSFFKVDLETDRSDMTQSDLDSYILAPIQQPWQTP